jgi:hypothetical protein
VVAWARESLAVFSEQVMFYGDKARTQPIFGFVGKTGEVGYKVTDRDGQLIGEFRKDVYKSALRSTWELSTPDGMTALGRERSKGVASTRRILDLFGSSWLRYDFDFVTGDGNVLLTSDSGPRVNMSYTSKRRNRVLVLAVCGRGGGVTRRSHRWQPRRYG